MTNQAKRYSPEFKQSLAAFIIMRKDRCLLYPENVGLQLSSISKWIDDEKIISFDQGKPISQK